MADRKNSSGHDASTARPGADTDLLALVALVMLVVIVVSAWLMATGAGPTAQDDAHVTQQRASASAV